MTSMDHAVRMIKLGDNFLVPLDRLPADLRRRWDIAQSKADSGEDVKGLIATLMREISGVVGVDALMRAAHKAPQSALNIGMDENTSRIKDLSAQAQALADEAKQRAGKERVRVVE